MAKKWFQKALSVGLSLALCAGLAVPGLAASFSELQGVIDDKESLVDEVSGTERISYDTETDTVKLHEDVAYDAEKDGDNKTINIDEDVTIDMNDHNITGNGEDAVIEVEADAALTITGKDDETPEDGTHNTISNNPDGGEITVGADGIDVEAGGELVMDGVTVTDTDTGVNVEGGDEEKHGTATIANSTFEDNNTGVYAHEGSKVTLGDGNTFRSNKSGITYEITVGGKQVTYSNLDPTVYAALTQLGVSEKTGTDWARYKTPEAYKEQLGEYLVLYTGTGEMGSGIAVKAEDDISWSSSYGFVIPQGVTSIGKEAFYGRSRLTSVTIPASVTSIGGAAFAGCERLTSVTIPASVKSIGYSAFASCWKLTSVTIPEGVTSIGESAFASCYSLTSVTIPEGVTSIGKGTFSGCTGLISVTIPEGVTSIGEGAFYNCSRLKSMTIPAGVTSIGERAFWWCGALKSVTIPNTVTSIGKYAFEVCGLESINIPASVTSIGEGAFRCCQSLESVVIPGSVTRIEDSVFSYCYVLHSVTIPNSVTSIGKNAFTRCTNLMSINIPASVKSIGESAFEGSLLFSINIPASVESIGKNAFCECGHLTYATIPDSVTSIGANAFKQCPDLKTILVTENEHLEEDALKELNGHWNTFTVKDGKIELISSQKENWLTIYSANGEKGSDVDIKEIASLLKDKSVTVDEYGNIYFSDCEVTSKDGAGKLIPLKGFDKVWIDTDARIHGRFAPETDNSDNDNDNNNDTTPIDDEQVPLAGLFTRADAIGYLWQQAGEPEAELSDFPDVPEDHQWAVAIGWAQDMGIALVDEEGNFRPDDLVLRSVESLDVSPEGELQEFLDRYAVYAGAEFEGHFLTLEGAFDDVIMGEEAQAIFDDFFAKLEAALAQAA